MPGTARLLVVLGVLAMSVPASSPARGQAFLVRQENARKALKQLGGKAILGTGKDSRTGEPYEALVGFDLRGSLVIDGALEYLEDLTRYGNARGDFRSLDLSGLEVTDKGLVHLRNLVFLERLSLGGTKVEGEGLRHLEGLVSLRTLDLGLLRISDADLVHLRGLVNLEELRLGQSGIEGPGLAHLRALPKLTALDFSGRIFLEPGDVSGPVLARVKELRGLKRLVISDLAHEEHRNRKPA